VSTEPQSSPPPAPSPEPPPTPGSDSPGASQGAAQQPVPLPHHKIRPTRLSGLWVAVVFFAIILLLLLIFILQNSKTVDISYFGAHGHLPLGVALLLAAVCGVLLAVFAGVARISQLRAVARKHRRTDARRVTGTDATADPRG
jgi:lipopolysaccharide assembly protein A